MRKSTKPYIVLVLALLGLFVFAACRKAGQGDTTGDEQAEVTRITDATVPATHVWKQPTTIIKTEATPGAETPTPASDQDKLVARGKGLYEKLECNSCHGDSGEGVADKGSKLAGTELTEEEFKDILRTGDKGRLGNDHLYGTSAISESGIGVVYLYLQSLGPGE